jgi:hypothetical protein
MNDRAKTIAGVAVDDRRQNERVTGPFDGFRVDLIDTPVRIYDLSEGGCFVNSPHDQQLDVEVVLKIDLPIEGWITVTARTLYRKPGFGFAVRFTQIPEEASARLTKVISQLKARGR